MTSNNPHKVRSLVLIFSTLLANIIIAVCLLYLAATLPRETVARLLPLALSSYLLYEVSMRAVINFAKTISK